jgi:hypothetical protein
MKPTILAIILACTSLIASCSPAVSTERPDDFSLAYHWQEGSLPPPYHYEYTITLQPEGRGQIEMIPDYAFEEPPTWTKTFSVSFSDLDQLYGLRIREGFFQTNWRAQSDPPVGGSSDSLVVTAYSNEIEIPSFVLFEQEEAQSRIVAAIQALVPAEIWEKLNQQREQYMQEH